MLHQLALQHRDERRASSSAPARTASPRRSGWPRRGDPVTVLEAADRAGGAVRTDELTLPGLPPRHVLLRVSGGGRVAGVRAHAARAPRAALGPSGGLLRAPAAGRARGGAVPRPRRAPRRSLDSRPRRRRRSAGGSSSRRCSSAFEALRATMLAGVPAGRGRAALLGALGPVGAVRFAGLLPGSAQGLGAAAVRRRAARGRGCTARPAHGDVPPTGAGSAIAVTYLNLIGHAVGWPSPRGGAERLTDALVGLPARAAAARCGPARAVEAIESARGRVTGVRARRRRARRRPTS